jgi:4-azaleucine resistance transporter AzlC
MADAATQRGRRDRVGVPNVAFSARGALRGARRTLPVGLSAVAFGLLFGVLSRQAGLSLVEASLMSALVFAGSSQLVAVNMWASPIPVIAIVATTFLINLRHVLMGLTLQPLYSRLPGPKAYGSLFFLTDESWALATIESREGRGDGAFLLGSGLLLFVCWAGATAVGRITGAAIRDPSAWGLDFAFAAVFLTLLTSHAEGRSNLLPWALAAAVAIAADRLLPGSWYVLLGAAAGSLPAVWRRSDG